jgi:hypothetical protein
MPSRSVRRRHHKRLKRLHDVTSHQRDVQSAIWLSNWRREAYRRARDLNAPIVWGLAADPPIRKLAAVLDPDGGVQEDLNRICAEAVASEVGGCLVRASRPVADRGRLLWSKSPS